MVLDEISATDIDDIKSLLEKVKGERDSPIVIYLHGGVSFTGIIKFVATSYVLMERDTKSKKIGINKNIYEWSFISIRDISGFTLQGTLS